MPSLRGPLFNNWPNSGCTWLFKGETFVTLAWLNRGGGYANQVGEQAFQQFFDQLGVAEDALSNAWRLDPTDARIPTEMIRVDEGLEKKRDEMEVWFNRAMACNSNDYTACSYKLHYLYPQWYGSREDMVAFGRECVASTQWGGTVPLILVDAHNEYARFLPGEDQTNYWKLPDVWPDVKAAYDRYFELYPNDTAKYNNYAYFAYRCEQMGRLPGPVAQDRHGGLPVTLEVRTPMMTWSRRPSHMSRPNEHVVESSPTT